MKACMKKQQCESSQVRILCIQKQMKDSPLDPLSIVAPGGIRYEYSLSRTRRPFRVANPSPCSGAGGSHRERDGAHARGEEEWWDGLALAPV